MRDAGKAEAARRWFVGTWLLLCALKLALAARVPLFVDEAFYWQEGQHLAWAYSDLPGLTAWLARLGVAAFGQHELGLRMPFLLIGALVPWLLVRMTAREIDARAGYRAGLLALLLPLAGTLGLLALPDVPLLLATLLCLDAGLRLLRGASGFAAFELGLGLAMGGLTHYRFAAVIAVGFAVLLMLREGRRALRDWHVWAAVAVGALAWLPLLLWNLQNADAGLRFQLVDRHPWQFSGAGIELGLMQLMTATPLLLAAMAVAAWRGLRDPRSAARWLAASGALIVLGFFALGFFADRERVSFHWPLPGFVALLPLLPAVLAGWPRFWRIATLATTALGLAGMFGYFALATTSGEGQRTANDTLYPANFAGWTELDAAVRTRLASMPPETRLLAGDFKIGSELGFARGDANIAVLDHPLNHKHGRAPQLALWGLQDDRPRSTPILLVVASSHVNLREQVAYFQQLCERVGALSPPQVLNVRHGRQRFLMFALPAERAAGPCTAPAVAYLNEPEAGSEVTGVFAVNGWAIKDVAGIEQVLVTLDGKPIAQADYGGEDAQVQTFYHGRSRDPNHPRVGFSAVIDSARLPPGDHWLGLLVQGKDGSGEAQAERPIRVRGRQ